MFSTGELATLSGIYGNVFDTFARTIIVYKEPKKTIVPQNTNNGLYGFGEQQTTNIYSYTPVTGVFQARVRYADESAILVDSTNTYIPVSPVTIRVRQDGQLFIDNGVTDKIEVDGKAYKIDGESTKNSFLALDYWTYKLRSIT
jgi:hypothetical protein